MFPTTQNSAMSLAQALTESQVQPSSSNAGKAFLKFDFKTGDFAFGRDAVDITDEEILINTYSIVHGWILWVNGSAQKEMVPFNQALPQPMEAQAGNQPSEARGFEARFMDDEETVLVFESNSYGGRQGVDNVLNAIKGRAIEGETDFLFPLVKLNSNSYKAKAGNTIHNPQFEVVAWLDQNGNKQEADAPALEEKQEEAKPVRRRRA
jgi:hypothetical protein